MHALGKATDTIVAATYVSTENDSTNVQKHPCAGLERTYLPCTAVSGRKLPRSVHSMVCFGQNTRKLLCDAQCSAKHDMNRCLALKATNYTLQVAGRFAVTSVSCVSK